MLKFSSIGYQMTTMWTNLVKIIKKLCHICLFMWFNLISCKNFRFSEKSSIAIYALNFCTHQHLLVTHLIPFKTVNFWNCTCLIQRILLFLLLKSLNVRKYIQLLDRFPLLSPQSKASVWKDLLKQELGLCMSEPS